MIKITISIEQIATKKNLKAKAENGSLFWTIGRVVINAEDQRSMNRRGKDLDTLFFTYL